MKLTSLALGQHWGELAKFRNIVSFRLSPYELRPFGGVITKGVPNVLRRIRGQMFRVAPPTIAAYLIYDWAEAENARLSRKNPKDFENDV